MFAKQTVMYGHNAVDSKCYLEIEKLTYLDPVQYFCLQILQALADVLVIYCKVTISNSSI